MCRLQETQQPTSHASLKEKPRKTRQGVGGGVPVRSVLEERRSRTK
jgi:hypothetical protein